MKKIYIVGIAFAAIFAFSLASVSGASAFSWDECTAQATVLEFTNSDCNVIPGTAFGWLEITVATSTDSLLVTLLLESDGVDIDCEGFVDGTVGGGANDRITEILNDAGELLEVGVLEDVCSILADPLNFCGGAATAQAAPVHLPWATELNANGDSLLEVMGHPGWFIKCGSPVKTNECTRAESHLTVANLEAELEVDLGFKPLEEATCTEPAPFGSKGKVEGTVSILLGGTERALRAM